MAKNLPELRLISYTVWNQWFNCIPPETSKSPQFLDIFRRVQNAKGGVLKVALLHGYFSNFLNCTNGAKSSKVSQTKKNLGSNSGSGISHKGLSNPCTSKMEQLSQPEPPS